MTQINQSLNLSVPKPQITKAAHDALRLLRAADSNQSGLLTRKEVDTFIATAFFPNRNTAGALRGAFAWLSSTTTNANYVFLGNEVCHEERTARLAQDIAKYDVTGDGFSAEEVNAMPESLRAIFRLSVPPVVGRARPIPFE